MPAINTDLFDHEPRHRQRCQDRQAPVFAIRCPVCKGKGTIMFTSGSCTSCDGKTMVMGCMLHRVWWKP